jgi:hypothetical protein
MSNGTPHQHAHEVRLGLVMYGGVSLADADILNELADLFTAWAKEICRAA